MDELAGVQKFCYFRFIDFAMTSSEQLLDNGFPALLTIVKIKTVAMNLEMKAILCLPVAKLLQSQQQTNFVRRYRTTLPVSQKQFNQLVY